jgi:aryl-alcohol dehydrogenase-like predicted oxidoreductase
MLAACDRQPRASCDRLHRHLYLHIDDADTPIAETVGAVGDLIRAARSAISVSRTIGAGGIAEVVSECESQGVPLPVVCQPYYNLLNRVPEVEILPACDYYGIGVAPYSPIARGVLTGKYAAGAVRRAPAVGAQGCRMTGDGVPRGIDRDRAEARGATRARPDARSRSFALAWLWANRIVTSVHRGPAHVRPVARLRRCASGRNGTTTTKSSSIRWSRPGHPSKPGYSDPQYPFFGRMLD